MGGINVLTCSGSKGYERFTIVNSLLQLSDDEWEKDLAAEDFEVVDDQENVDESELDLDLK